MSDTNPRTDLAGWFNLIIDGLYRFVAAHAGLHRNRRDVPVVVLLCNYLVRVARRFAALVARGGAPARPGRPGRHHSPRTPRPKLPSQKAWLLYLVPLVGNNGSQFRTMLVSEEFAALLIAQPSVGRLLRPLCRMFGIGPDDLALPPALFQIPPRPAKPPPEAAAAPAATAPAATVPPGCSLPPVVPQADGPIPDPPPEFRPKQA